MMRIVELRMAAVDHHSRRLREAWPGALLALALAGCGAGAGNAGTADAGAGEARAGEIACQQRLIQLSGGPVPRRTGLAGGFAQASERFDRMPLDGCTDNQRLSARSLARATRALASTAARVGDLDAFERRPERRDSPDFRELQSQIEGFEHRRQALREDLRRMTRDEH